MATPLDSPLTIHDSRTVLLVEPADEPRFAESVALDRLHHRRARGRCFRLRAGGYIDLRVECEQLERVVMIRAVRRRAGTHVTRRAEADLPRAVRQFRDRHHTFWQSG